MDLPNLRWEGRSHYVFWAQYLDPDYDPDVDVEPRMYVAWLTRENLFTSAGALLNCDDWKNPTLLELVEWLKTQTFDSAYDMENKVESWQPSQPSTSAA